MILVVSCAVVGCGPEPECGPNAICLMPQVYVDVCAEPQRQLAGEIIGGVDDCTVDFGVVGAFGSERRVRFTNPGYVDAALDFFIDSDRFSIVSAPTTVEGGFAAEALLRAASFADAAGVVVVTTDAANVLGGTIEIELSAGAKRASRE